VLPPAMLPEALLPVELPPAPALEPAPVLPVPVVPAPLVPVALPVRELDPAPPLLAIDPLDDTFVRMNPPPRLLPPLLLVDPAPPAVDEPAPPALEEPEPELPFAAIRHPVTVMVCPLLCDCPPERVLELPEVELPEVELPEPDCPLPVLPLPVDGVWAPTPTASAALNIVPKMN